MKEGSEWEQEQHRAEKKRDLFADILEDRAPGESKRKRTEDTGTEVAGKRRKESSKVNQGESEGKHPKEGNRKCGEEVDTAEGAKKKAKKLRGTELDAQLEMLGVRGEGEEREKKPKKKGRDGKKMDVELAEMSTGGDRSGDAEIEELFSAKKRKAGRGA